jgi:alcohol dehydrogenase
VNPVALPDAVDDVAAAGLGCRFATAYRAVVQVGRLQPGEWLAVHGCGGVGLSAVMIGAALGARVVGVDVSEGAREAALGAGAEEVVAAAAAGEALLEVTSGGAHVSLDAIGHEAALAASVAGLHKRGRHVQVGLLPEPPRVPMDLVIARELELLGSHGMAARAYPELLALVEAGRLRPGDLVTREIGLDDAPAALAAMGEPGPPGVTVIRV